jgi:DNA-binding transcriptional LysR family regulator
VVATPAYLRKHGTPATPDDLPAHECIQFDVPSSGRRLPWIFQQEGETLEMVTAGAYGTAEDALGGATLARAGAGLFQTYRFVVEQDLRDGTLVEVLQAYGGCTRPFMLLYPHARHVSRRVRAFVDFLVDKFAA